MPRTSQGHPYRIRELDEAANCVVCGHNDGQPGIEVVMPFTWPEGKQYYGFPVCSLVCVVAWSELLGRCLDGDSTAIAMVIAYAASHEPS